MVNNHHDGGCPEIIVFPSQDTLHLSLTCLVMHLVVTMKCTPANAILQPLHNILNNDERMKVKLVKYEGVSKSKLSFCIIMVVS